MSPLSYLQLLGTGAGDANFDSAGASDLPVRDRRRYTCNYLTPDVLIDFNNHTPGALHEFGIDPASIRHLLISHGHFDHFQPLEIIRFAAGLPHPLKVYGNSMVIDALELCRECVFDEASGRFVSHEKPFNLETTRLSLGMPSHVGEHRVTPMLGNHFMNKPYSIMEQQVFNYLIETGEKRLFYGLDSSYLMPQTIAELTGTHLDVAILDATFGPLEIDSALSGHNNWAMIDETLDEMRAIDCIDDTTLIVAAHLSCGSVGPHEEMAGAQAQRGITVSYDGLILPL